MKKIFMVLSTIALPVISFAATDDKGLNVLIDNLKDVLGNLYGLILSAIFIAFAWGVLKFVFKSGDDQEQGKSMMIWSIVAITILGSIYGIVGVFQDTVGVEESSADIFPELPGSSQNN